MLKSCLNVCFIGGDRRQKYAAEELSKYAKVTATGDCFVGSIGVGYFESPMKALHGAHIIVLPLPAVKGETALEFTKLVEHASKNNAVVLGGMFSAYMKDMMDAHNVAYFDYYDDECFTIRNAYLTAEGALSIAMNELERDIKSTSFAIFGYGRIGSALGEMLSACKAKITVFARRDDALTIASERGLNVQYITNNEDLDFDVIINTVPARVITNEQLLGLKGSTLLIELASPPGGFDSEIAEQSGVKVIRGGGLPGKYAPISAGKAVAETLLKIMKREALL